MCRNVYIIAVIYTQFYCPRTNTHTHTDRVIIDLIACFDPILCNYAINYTQIDLLFRRAGRNGVQLQQLRNALTLSAEFGRILTYLYFKYQMKNTLKTYLKYDLIKYISIFFRYCKYIFVKYFFILSSKYVSISDTFW